jgi:adenosylcobinamide-phosphate synthase
MEAEGDMFYSLIALIIGFCLDLILGDPHGFWHPIPLIGKLIVLGERILRAVFPKTKKGEFVAGIFLVLCVAGLSTVVPALLLYFLYQWNLYVGLLIESIFCYQLLATKSLKVESMKVYEALRKGDIKAGRNAVAMIVGRDTKNLLEGGIIKATVETIAENTADGSIAPMLYMVFGGAPLGFFYKAINTMDSMVGYKNQQYLYFGKAAAKMDDILNYIPARLSAYLIIVSTVFTKYNTKNTRNIYRRDRFNHASPNSAHTEAAMAGALEVELAGDAYYFGTLYSKKTIGEDRRPIEIEDIKRANGILYLAAILGMVIFSMIKILVCFVK